MTATLGIRREDKNLWERRVPLTPWQVRKLTEEHALLFVLQPSPIRICPDATYEEAGATIDEDLSDCDVVLAVKEIPQDFFLPGKTYVFFSHTIKGQAANMPMLQRMMELGCNLIDYERIVDDQGRRLIFFGRYAGLAGMLDTLWALGKRLESEGMPTPFSKVRMAHDYAGLPEAEKELKEIEKEIFRHGLPEAITPFVVGFAGYGNVSLGAQEIVKHLPVEEISPRDLNDLASYADNRHVYKVVFKEQDMVSPVEKEAGFDLLDYYEHPEKYRSTFEPHLHHLSVLVNCIYWDERYPRLVTKEAVQRLWGGGEPPRLRVIGDISCDIEGSVEVTVKATDPGDPVYVYEPGAGKVKDGWEGVGPVIMAVDNLPCELPRESSEAFGEALMPFLPLLANADYDAPLIASGLPEAVRDAVIVWQGKLTKPFEYIADHF